MEGFPRERGEGVRDRKRKRRKFGEPRWAPRLGGGVSQAGWDGRVDRAASPRVYVPSAEDERVPITDLLPLEDEDRRSKPIALLTALTLHLVLLSLAFSPTATPELPEVRPRGAIRVSRWMPPPPPQRLARPRVVQEKVEARKIPVPDPTPEDPEPIIEPEAPRKVQIPPDVDVVLGPAVPPPQHGAPVPAGTAGVTYPVLIESSKVQPVYPEFARKAKVMGNVIVEAVVRRDGTVGDAEILRTPAAGLGFEEAALAAVRQWRFRPGLFQGEPVDVQFTIIVEFILR